MIGGWTVITRPGRGILPPSPSKGGYGNTENDKGGGRKRGRHIVLMQRKVGKLGELGKTTGWIHRSELVKSGRVNNLGGVKCNKFDERGRLQITVLKKGK